MSLAGAPAPAYGTGSLAELLPTVLAGMAVPDQRLVLDVPAADRVVVALVDGLGLRPLERGRRLAPFLASLLDTAPGAAICITSVFPSTTPVALTSLGTGLPPGQHGLTGLFLRLPEDGTVLDTLKLGKSAQWRALQPRPTCFELAEAAGVAVTRVGPAAFDGDGLTEVGMRGGRYATAESVGERVDEVAAGLRRGARSLTYVYFGELDATGHRRGCASLAWQQELMHLDGVLEQLAQTLPPGGLLVVTADHGMVDVPFDHRWDLAAEPSLDEGVVVLAGDPRGAQVHTVPGAADDVLAAWRDVLGEHFWVCSRDEAVALGWFGAVAPHVRGRIGDVVAAARTDVAVVDSRRMPEPILSLLGMHGSLTDDELLVPLLVATG